LADCPADRAVLNSYTGPTALPAPVVERMRADILDFRHAQKNIGIAGVTLVIVRRSLLHGIVASPRELPAILDYRTTTGSAPGLRSRTPTRASTPSGTPTTSSLLPLLVAGGTGPPADPAGWRPESGTPRR
jgi:hypothetical protein